MPRKLKTHAVYAHLTEEEAHDLQEYIECVTQGRPYLPSKDRHFNKMLNQLRPQRITTGSLNDQTN